MIRWALEYLKLDTMPVWLASQPDGHYLYLRFGWRDVEEVNTDLSQWAGPCSGYRLHCTICMLREASQAS